MRVSKRISSTSDGDGLLAGLSISQHQIDHVAQPHASARLLVGPQVPGGRYIGRPWFVWKDDPDLARMVNDRLAAASN